MYAMPEKSFNYNRAAMAAPQHSAKAQTSLAVTILADESLNTCDSANRGTELASNLYRSFEESGVATSTASYGLGAHCQSLAQRAFRATMNAFTRRRLYNVALTTEEVISKLEKMGRMQEDTRVLVLIATGANLDFAISETTTAYAESLGVELVAIRIDVAARRSYVMRRGFQICFNDSVGASSTAIVNLIRRNVLGASK